MNNRVKRKRVYDQERVGTHAMYRCSQAVWKPKHSGVVDENEMLEKRREREKRPEKEKGKEGSRRLSATSLSTD